MEYVIGERYPLPLSEALKVVEEMWPMVMGTPDESRGRRFLKAPCDWEFWMEDGTKVSFSFTPGQAFIASQSSEPDPNIPEPMGG